MITQIPEDLPLVYADRDRAVQVMNNLLTNALRYTPSPGRVTISVSRRTSVAGAAPRGEPNDTAPVSAHSGRHYVLFGVADSGIGIEPQHLAHLFERFYRVDRSRSRATGGTGIGLTIARALVEAMGGRIWADSPGPGRGATFAFTLPRAG